MDLRELFFKTTSQDKNGLPVIRIGGGIRLHQPRLPPYPPLLEFFSPMDQPSLDMILENIKWGGRPKVKFEYLTQEQVDYLKQFGIIQPLNDVTLLANDLTVFDPSCNGSSYSNIRNKLRKADKHHLHYEKGNPPWQELFETWKTWADKRGKKLISLDRIVSYLEDPWQQERRYVQKDDEIVAIAGYHLNREYG